MVLVVLAACVTPTGTASSPSAESHDSPSPPDSAPPPDYEDPGWGSNPQLNWPEATIALAGDYGVCVGMAVLDLDQDGAEDFVVQRFYADDISWYGHDLAVYTAGVSGSVSLGSYDYRQAQLLGSPTVYPDVDGDGLDDVLIFGSGVFSGAQLSVATELSPADAIAGNRIPVERWVGDVDGDGHEDQADYSSMGGYIHSDTGRPVAASIFLTSGVYDESAGWVRLTSTSEVFDEERVSEADWHSTSDRDGDGLLDVWANPGIGRWRLYASSGLVDGEVDVRQDVDGGGAGCNGGDLDGDEVDDLVIPVDGGLVAVLATDGDVDPATLPAVLPSAGTLDTPERVADADGDGLQDFVARASSGGHDGWARVSGAMLLTGGTIDVGAPEWLVETADTYVEIDADGRSIWIDDAINGGTGTRHSRVPLAGTLGTIDYQAATISFDSSMDVMGSGDVTVRWWETPEGRSMVVLARAAPYGLARVPFDTLQRYGPVINNWRTWATDGPVGWLPDLDHDGEPEILLESGGRVSRWSIDAVLGAGVELATVEDVATTDLVTWEGGTPCDLDGDGVDDPLSSQGPIRGASVLDTSPGIDLLAAIPDVGGCVGDLDGDGVGELASSRSAAEGRLYSGAEAAAGRATVVYTYPEGAGPGIGLAVDADGDGADDIPWVDETRAGWLAAWPDAHPVRTDFLRGIVGGENLGRLHAWPPDQTGVFGVESTDEEGYTQIALYDGVVGWEWWTRWDQRLGVADELLLSVAVHPDDPESALVGVGVLTPGSQMSIARIDP